MHLACEMVTACTSHRVSSRSICIACTSDYFAYDVVRVYFAYTNYHQLAFGAFWYSACVCARRMGDSSLLRRNRVNRITSISCRTYLRVLTNTRHHFIVWIVFARCNNVYILRVSTGVTILQPQDHSSFSQRKSDFARRHLRFTYIYFDFDSEHGVDEHDGIMMMDYIQCIHTHVTSYNSHALLSSPLEIVYYLSLEFLNFLPLDFFPGIETNTIFLGVILCFIDPHSESL